MNLNRFTPPLSDKDTKTLTASQAARLREEAELLEQCTCGTRNPCRGLKLGGVCDSAKPEVITEFKPSLN